MSVGLHWVKTLTSWFFMMGLITSASIKKEITCYVCTPPKMSDNTEVLEFDVTFPNYNIEMIPTCGSSAAMNFTLKCPEGYKGCLTKSYGEQIMKLCNNNKYSITDCKIANNVKYCFCANNLCNGATILSPIPITSDDEDLDQSTDDGSGQFDDWTQLDKHKYTEKNINTEVILNDTIIKKNSTSNSSKLILPKSINILSLVVIIIYVI